MRFQSSLNVVRCVEQLRQGLRESLDWVSDGSMSKIVRGRLKSIQSGRSGLELILTNGRQVSWRMNLDETISVLSSFHNQTFVQYQ